MKEHHEASPIESRVMAAILEDIYSKHLKRSKGTLYYGGICGWVDSSRARTGELFWREMPWGAR